ncbi:MAG: DUF3127 domain-containing protein [Bacteroidales bacterium]|nr:DUF3127 domain-containing protein [Bacteroidales bacterium]
MEIKGKLFEILDAQKGSSAKGQWKKQDFIIETDEKFPKKICISNWNDKVDLNSLRKGDIVNVSINLESREFNGKWYTDVKVWKIEKESNPNSGDDGIPEMPPPPDDEMFFDNVEDETDDLPF